jgi:hypothetical protein
MQPTAQAVGTTRKKRASPEGAKDESVEMRLNRLRMKNEATAKRQHDPCYSETRLHRAGNLFCACTPKNRPAHGFKRAFGSHPPPASKAQATHLLSMADSIPFDLTETIALLTRTPPILEAMLRGLPNAWLRGNEGIASDGKESWNAFDVVGHLIVGERTDWMPRVRIMLENGESRPFDPFDRFAQSRENRSAQENVLDQLLDEFARLRKENLIALRALNLQPDDLARRGTHPALGTVTLSQLLATWAVHDLTHLHQLSRVMAHQYCDAVGPWKAYLGVLHCAGHSAL